MSIGSGIYSQGRQLYKNPPLSKLIICILLFAQIISTGTCDQASAAERPLWEMGVGLFPSSFPGYRGSEDRNNYLLPFPYLVYRGDVLKVDREGVRAQLFDTDRVELNLSLSAAVPVKSDDADAREDMPDLDPTFEIGPSLNLHLLDIEDTHKLSLRLPVRAVIASDFSSAEHVGWVFHPNLNLDFKLPEDWKIGLSVGPQFADQNYHQYYYSVESHFATADRPEYRASGGYSGLATTFSFSHRFDHFWIGGFMRYDNLSGATFNDSPLVETDHSLMGGVAIAWVLGKSSKMVKVKDD